MFKPSIYLNHRTLQLIVNLEKRNQEIKTLYKDYLKKTPHPYLINYIKLFAPADILSEIKAEKILVNKVRTGEIAPLINAIQAVENHETSLRAEDDWNLLKRINNLLTKKYLTSDSEVLRGSNLPKKLGYGIELYNFGNHEQLEHSVIETLRWYRSNENEVNSTLRILTIIYYFLKASPFSEKNKETIFTYLIFSFKENDLPINKLISFYDIVNENIQKNIDLNDFVNNVLERMEKEMKALIFDYQKRVTEITAPRKILNLNKRQIQLLKILLAKDKITRMETADMLGISFMTAYRDIKGLVNKRLLVELGNGRGTYYVLASKKKS